MSSARAGAGAGAGAGTGDWGGSGGSRTSGVQTAAAATHSSSRALVCRDGAWWAVAYIKTSCVIKPPQKIAFSVVKLSSRNS